MSPLAPILLSIGLATALPTAAEHVAPPLNSLPQDPDPRLERAAELLKANEEGKVREGADICVAVDDQDAATLLLEQLDNMTHNRGLAPGHYRDVAWDGLVRITDHYARMRVETELKKNRKNPWTRMWCAELLGLYGERDWGESLTNALKDKDVWVKRAAARSLGQIGYEEALFQLGKLAKHKDDRLRADVLEAMARIDPAKHGVALAEAVDEDREPGVRCALLAAAHAVLPEDQERLSAGALTDDDWRVRLQAVDNLGTTRTKTAVDRLIEALEDGRPTVGVRSMAHLRALTHQPHTRPEQWQRWWRDNRDSFTFPEGGALAPPETGEGDTVAVYNGIRVTSDHVAFLIDKSHAMGEQLNHTGTSKEQAARDQLEQVLAALPGGVLFNVYTYELDFEAYARKPEELDPKQAKKALEFVDKQNRRGAKDIWQVLEAVVSDPAIDTIYLLSSGEPDTGLYVHWSRVTRHLKDLNRFHKVTVHTVAYSGNQWHRDQLEKISEATGGEFKWFE